MEPRVLQLDDRGAGDPLVLVPRGLTGWLFHHIQQIDALLEALEVHLAQA